MSCLFFCFTDEANVRNFLVSWDVSPIQSFVSFPSGPVNTCACRTMGSISSLVAGNSLNNKHCKASDYRLKEEINTHRKSGGCNLDGLLKCGFAQSSSSTTHHSRGLSHSRSGRSEDFFYIKVRYCKYDWEFLVGMCRNIRFRGNVFAWLKVNHKPRSTHHRERSLEDVASRDKDSDGRSQPKLLFMPGKILERVSLELSCMFID